MHTDVPQPQTLSRCALITGGGSGIGLALATRLVGEGMRVVLVGRDRARLDAACAALGDRACGEVLDVADPDAVVEFARAFAAREPRLDLLVCNAGRAGRQGARETTPAQARAIMAVNFHGVVDVTRALWPMLVASGGAVVNVVSVAGAVAAAYDAPYTASKHAALGWSRALAATAARDGVRVLTVNPGPVVTPGFRQRDLLAHPLARHLVISDTRCADAIVRALARGSREIFVPGYWRLAAIVQAALPGPLAKMAVRVWPRRAEAVA